MRDVVIYRRALDSREICQLAKLLVQRGGASYPPASAAPLVAAGGGN
ncbi:MAG: hypothetical protein VYE73_09420 [Acidobacteriota bacterium]|nr:hypothetical protein [Acidobacteriota bacterium]